MPEPSEPLFERPILSVSELTLRIKETLEGNVGHVWVSGAISGFKRHRESGHCYFSLKDEGAVLKSVMFRFHARNLEFDPEEGLEVVAFGRISVYPPRGEYQLYVEHMQPKGMGILQLRFEQLKKKLQAEGLFAEERKRPLPFLPAAIGVITSSEGAAFQDIVKTIHKRFPARVVLHDVRVQGEGAAREIALAIRAMPRVAPEVEVLIVGRGGGSIEDLWAFNEEPVVRAIANSRVPVVSAVGHETDFTLADFAADVRAKTPTEAGVLVVPVYEDLVRSLEDAESRLRKRLREVVEHAALTLDRYFDSYGLRSVETIAERHGEHLRLLRGRADRAVVEGVHRRRESLAALTGRSVLRDPRTLLRPFEEQVRRLLSRPGFMAPERRAELDRIRLASLHDRLNNLGQAVTEAYRQRLKTLSQQLAELDPEKVLERGYSITEYSGRVVTDAASVPPGSEIVTRLAKGTLRSVTLDKNT